MEKKDFSWMTVLRHEHDRLFWSNTTSVGIVNPLPKGTRVIASKAPSRERTKNTLHWRNVHSQNERKRRYLPIE